MSRNRARVITVYAISYSDYTPPEKHEFIVFGGKLLPATPENFHLQSLSASVAACGTAEQAAAHAAAKQRS